MKIKNVLAIALFSTISLSAQETLYAPEITYKKFILPESFKAYKVHPLKEGVQYNMPVYLSPMLNKKLKILKKINQKYADKLIFKLLGEKISISTKEGNGGDNNFLIEYKSQKIKLLGSTLLVSEAGYFYLQGRDNYDYTIRKKFKLTTKGVKEVKQSAYLVDLECTLSRNAILYEKKHSKGAVVARLPKGKKVRVLIHDNSKNGDSSSNQYLISTPFGLLGWVSSTSGYMRTGGKPLNCLLYVGA